MFQGCYQRQSGDRAINSVIPSMGEAGDKVAPRAELASGLTAELAGQMLEELVGEMVTARRAHVFADTKGRCVCGFGPPTVREWHEHQAKVMVWVLGEWSKARLASEPGWLLAVIEAADW